MPAGQGPESIGTTKKFNPATRRAAILTSVAGVAALYMFYPYPPKSKTGNPIETPGTQNISNRFSSGGAKGEYTPGVATPRNSAENVSSPQEGEGRKDSAAARHLEQKHGMQKD